MQLTHSGEFLTMSNANPRLAVSNFLPPHLRDALVATKTWPVMHRYARIDALTLEASRQYPELVRPPSDMSMTGLWVDMRSVRPA